MHIDWRETEEENLHLTLFIKWIKYVMYSSIVAKFSPLSTNRECRIISSIVVSCSVVNFHRNYLACIRRRLELIYLRIFCYCLTICCLTTNEFGYCESKYHVEYICFESDCVCDNTNLCFDFYLWLFLFFYPNEKVWKILLSKHTSSKIYMVKGCYISDVTLHMRSSTWSICHPLNTQFKFKHQLLSAIDEHGHYEYNRTLTNMNRAMARCSPGWLFCLFCVDIENVTAYRSSPFLYLSFIPCPHFLHGRHRLLALHSLRPPYRHHPSILIRYVRHRKIGLMYVDRMAPAFCPLICTFYI